MRMKIKLSTLRKIIKEQTRYALKQISEGQHQGSSEEAKQLINKALEIHKGNEDIENLIRYGIVPVWKAHDEVGESLRKALDDKSLMMDSDNSPVYVAQDFVKDVKKVVQRALGIDKLSDLRDIERADEDADDAISAMKQISNSLTKTSPVGEVTKDISLLVQRVGHDAIERLIHALVKE